MEQPFYRLVFRGEIAYGYTEEEVRANLRQLTRFDEEGIAKCFSGRPTTLKAGVDEATARRYKAALDRTGAVCVIEPMETPREPAPPVSLVTCPACSHRQDGGLTCGRCGIVFARYEQVQARKAALAAAGKSAGGSAGSTGPEPGAGEGMAAYFAIHQEQAFLLKAFLLIVLIVLLRQFLSGGFLILAFFLFPIFFLCYVRLQAAVTDQDPNEVLAQHITFMPVMYAEGDRKREGAAWVTYSLIFLNILIFYAIEIRVDPQVLSDNYLFLPARPTAWNVPVSAFTSMFLHAGGGHLWGNMIFLWTVGTVVERRVGGGRFLALYLLAGLAANLFGAAVHRMFMGVTLHALGASGAIAGVMGIFAVRCYFKSMVFPLPILGIFSLILPVSLKIRLNSLVIIGLFFLADLSGGFRQVAGTGHSVVGHWIHIGGMLAGIGLAMFLRLGKDAIEERHLEIGAQAVDGGRGSLNAGEESLRLALRQNPENTEAMLLLARIESRYAPTEEGKDLYQRAIGRLAATRPQAAADAFREYYRKYLQGTEAAVLFRLAGIFHRERDLELASRCLEMVAGDHGAHRSIREKAMFQYARVLEEMGLTEAAGDCYARFIEEFPDSCYLETVRARAARA